MCVQSPALHPPIPSLQKVHGYHPKPQPSTHMICGMASPILSHLVSITQVEAKGLMNDKDISNYLGNSNYLEYVPGTRDKC